MNLDDIPEIEPDDVHVPADEVDRSRVTTESLVPEPNLAPSMAEVAATGALLEQAPDLSLFAVPPQAVTGHASAPPSVAPSSLAPTITDLEVISFAQQARRSQSTRVLLALAAVAIVGVGISVAMQGAPPSAAIQSPQLSVAAARPPTPKVQLEDLDANRPKPTAAVASSAAQAGAGAVAGQIPSVASTAILKATPARRVYAQGRRSSAAIAPQRTPPRDEAVESPAAVEGGPSWLVRAQQQEAAKESSER